MNTEAETMEYQRAARASYRFAREQYEVYGHEPGIAFTEQITVAQRSGAFWAAMARRHLDHTMGLTEPGTWGRRCEGTEHG